MKGDFILIHFMLQPLFEDIKNTKTTFTHLSFAHVYRGKITKGVRLSKEGLELQEELWEILNSSQEQSSSSYLHEPYF